MNKIENIIMQRQETHGDYEQFARTFIALLNTVMAAPHWDALDDVQKTSLIMTQFKAARVPNSPNHNIDDWDDIGGYASLAGKSLDFAAKFKEPDQKTNAGTVKWGPSFHGSHEIYEILRGELGRWRPNKEDEWRYINNIGYIDCLETYQLPADHWFYKTEAFKVAKKPDANHPCRGGE